MFSTISSALVFALVALELGRGHTGPASSRGLFWERPVGIFEAGSLPENCYPGTAYLRFEPSSVFLVGLGVGRPGTGAMMAEQSGSSSSRDASAAAQARAAAESAKLVVSVPARPTSGTSSGKRTPPEGTDPVSGSFAAGEAPKTPKSQKTHLISSPGRVADADPLEMLALPEGEPSGSAGSLPSSGAGEPRAPRARGSCLVMLR